MSIFGTIMSKVFGTHPAEAAPAPSAGAPAPSSGQPAPSSPPADASAAAPATTANETTGKPITAQEAPSTASAPSGGAAPSAPSTAPSSIDVAAVLDGMDGKAGQRLDWRHSIVDLMKLLDMDSSLSARKELAHELHYTGDTNDSAAMNMWLHKEVMTKFAENGGKLPPDLH